MRLVAYVLILGFASGLLARNPYIGALAGVVCWIVDTIINRE